MTRPGREDNVRGRAAPPCPRAPRYPEKVMKEEEGGGPGAAPYSSRPQVPGLGHRGLGPSPARGWQGAWGPVWELRGDRIEGLGGTRGGGKLPPAWTADPGAAVACSSGEDRS